VRSGDVREKSLFLKGKWGCQINMLRKDNNEKKRKNHGFIRRLLLIDYIRSFCMA
jgi:hypothetical protein